MRAASRALLVAILLLMPGCRSGAGGHAVEAAVINTAIAAGYAGVRRSEGDCFTPCTPGNRCNPRTGYCDPIPCRGECQQWERCDESGLIPHCVRDAPPDLGIVVGPGDQPPQPPESKPKAP